MVRKITKKNIKRSYIVWIILIIIIIFFSIASDNFFQISNFVSILRDALSLGILACGITFIMVSGLIDLSIGASVGMIVLTISLSVMRGGGLIGIFIIPLLISLSISLVNAVMIVKLKMPALIVTLAMLMVLKGIRMVIMGAHDISISDMPKIINFVSRSYVWGIPVSVYIFVLIIIVSSIILYKTPFGRKLFIVGANEKSAFLAGINTTAIRIFAFIILSVYIYICSFILVGRLEGYSITVGDNYEMIVLLAVVVGGTSFFGGQGSVIGSVGGVLLMSTLLNGLVLIRVAYEWQSVVLGIIFIFIIVLDRFYNKKKEYEFIK